MQSVVCIFVCFVSRVRVCMVRTLTPFIHMYNPFCDVNGDVLSNIMQFLEPIQVLVSICKFRVTCSSSGCLSKYIRESCLRNDGLWRRYCHQVDVLLSLPSDWFSGKAIQRGLVAK